jgi:predicted oxidoreductase
MAWNPLGSVFKNNDEKSVRVLSQAKLLADKYKVPVDVILIAWVLKHPANVFPVFGTTNMTRITTLAAAKNVVLELEDWFSLWVASTGNKVP